MLSNRRGILAIEVKSGTRFATPKGLAAFASEFRGVRSLVVGEGGVPLADFLTRSADDWLE